MTESSLITSMPDVFVEIDNRGRVLKYVGGGRDDSILQPDSMVDRRISDLWPPDAARAMLRNIRRALDTRDELSFRVKLPSEGRQVACRVRIIVRGFNRVLAILRVVNSPSDNSDLYDTKPVDTVTGIPRDTAFEEQLELMLADARLRERGLAVVAMDLDGINRINRSIGREVGDQVLRACADRLRSQLRGTDTFTRLGSDEFILAIADVDSRESAGGLGERLRNAFESTFDIDGHGIELHPSLGIALFPVDGENASTLLANARIALHEAGITGGKRHEFYSSTMRHRVSQRLDAKEELRWAIEHDQLRLRYQPRFQLSDDSIIGLEALLRWEHPIRGELSPEAFIDLAEAGGLMPTLGKWAIEQACQHAARWQQDGLDLTVSINVTDAEFAHPQFLANVRNALAESGLTPSRLQIELTERMLMAHERGYTIAHKLHSEGVRLVIDQFGLGYSSASKLIRFPIHAVKLGRDLLHNAASADPAPAALCAALVAMAHELGWETVAVGVESRDQLDWLRGLGCRAVQGYFLSVPLVADDVAELIDSMRDDGTDTNVLEMPLASPITG
ncbi:MAG: EAL domain-containing protein [Pseudomonadota bacterium]